MKKKIGTAMVVGAGISGIRSALDLAEFGYKVTLVDKAPHIGGILSQLDYQFPNDGCGMCKMLPMINRDASSQYCLRKGLFHENIEIVLGASLKSLEGEPGKFKAVLEQKPSLVDPNLCIGCNACAMVCPVDVPDEFNMGLGLRKAVYLPVPHNIPNTYVIDFINCSRCGACVTACPTGAIKFPEERRKNFHILVVDDELIVRDSLKEWLEDEGFSVDMADSGKTALDMLGQKDYHLMLTDIKMPGMDGVEVLKQAKAGYPEITVVMMTAYATVETAVEAMKIGALDYLLKPFDPQIFIPKILDIYQGLDVVEEREIDINALVLSTGTDYFNPLESKNTFGYGTYPDVVTSLEFERLLSGTGPNHGHIARQSDQKKVHKIAWFQCVGSRDLQSHSDFCSSVCCMHAIKEARLVKEKCDPDIEAAIFYMDMRAFGKTFHQYQDQAKQEYGVRFIRSRVHSVIENKEIGGLQVYYFDQQGNRNDAQFDMIVLSIGQRPSAGADKLARILDLELNEWGFCQPRPFFTSQSNVEGIFLGGSFAGLKDISESVIQSSSAALSASRFIHAAGGSLASEPDAVADYRNIARELPKILVLVCTREQAGMKNIDESRLKKQLKTDPTIADVLFMNRICTEQGWSDLTSAVLASTANRILIGTCLGDIYARRIKELAVKARIHPALIDVIDIQPKGLPAGTKTDQDVETMIQQKLKTGFSRLKRIDPPNQQSIPPVQKALVVGGGIAGMTAALSIADHGFEVDLVEQTNQLGGNLVWLKQTIDGYDVQTFLNETLEKVEKHPLLHVHTQTTVTNSVGRAGHFQTTLENKENQALQTIAHGTAIIATGGTAAPTTAYGYGKSPAIMTQKELEERLSDKRIEPSSLKTVVMIQCVDSRQKDQKNYCSRICCTSTLKHALHLKSANPDIAVYVFYRDMMAYGFVETYYTKAREAGIVFIQYDLENKPEVTPEESTVNVTGFEPILRAPIEIMADLLVLATGICPELPKNLADHFGIQTDEFGFFEEAESKWRPMDALKEGIFACGLCHSPRTITEAIASAQASAQRSLRLLGHHRLEAGSIVAQVHTSLCSLCERCIEACPYGARYIDHDLRQVLVDPLMCQGCGSCAAVCPNSASVLAGFKDQQVFDIIESVF
ncbi:MAG: response regulator [Pseudomonadota bacterium]